MRCFPICPLLLLLSCWLTCKALRPSVHCASGCCRSRDRALSAAVSSSGDRLDKISIESIGKYGDSAAEENTMIESLGTAAYNTVTKIAESMMFTQTNETKTGGVPITTALQKLKKDMEFLDDIAGRESQLTTVELSLLFSTVAISAVSPPLFGLKVVELLVPSMAALSAAIGVSAEYIGKVAMANGKEVAALAIQAAAESELIVAQAERVKAVLPFCVGIATAASAFALLAPSLASEMAVKYGRKFISEAYLVCPLVAVLATAIASLATQETIVIANRAIGVGNRRFASSKSVGRTWLSATEQVDASTQRTTFKWKSFICGILPAPLIATICPGKLGFKAIVCAATATAQSAYYLSIAEYYLAEAVDAVSVKARTAAIADTYANQGSRAGAILPFTSALAGLCAAATAAVAEVLPLVSGVELQSFVAMLFPSGAALFAAAASVSKARCEVDARAASAVAASGLSGEGPGQARDPNKAVLELLALAIKSSYTKAVKKVNKINIRSFPTKIVQFFNRSKPKPAGEL